MKGGDDEARRRTYKTSSDKSKSVEGDFMTTIDSFSDYLKNITKEYCVTENTNKVIIQKENTQSLMKEFTLPNETMGLIYASPAIQQTTILRHKLCHVCFLTFIFSRGKK